MADTTQALLARIKQSADAAMAGTPPAAAVAPAAPAAAPGPNLPPSLAALAASMAGKAPAPPAPPPPAPAASGGFAGFASAPAPVGAPSAPAAPANPFASFAAPTPPAPPAPAAPVAQGGDWVSPEGFPLFIDCIPEGVEIQWAGNILEEALNRLRAAGHSDYRTADFGKGRGVLSDTVMAVLSEPGVYRPGVPMILRTTNDAELTCQYAFRSFASAITVGVK